MRKHRRAYLEPDFFFPSVAHIPDALLRHLGIRYLICDIDNTLVTYDDPEPTAAALEFFSRMQSLGIRVSFLSNNGRERVERFNASLGYPAVWDGGKPLAGKAVRRLLEEGGATVGETLFVGDQIFTDLVTARCNGLRCALVPPIKDKTSLFFRSKRWLEKPFLTSFFRKYGKESERTPELLLLREGGAERKEREELLG